MDAAFDLWGWGTRKEQNCRHFYIYSVDKSDDVKMEAELTFPSFCGPQFPPIHPIPLEGLSRHL